MAVINIVGPIDKRLIAYPLLKAADTVGRVLVVTDDSNFRRFGRDFTTEFTLGRSDFMITRDLDGQIEELHSHMTGEYDVIIYITTNEILRSADKIIYCHGLNESVLPETEEWKVEGLEIEDVLITCKRTQPAEKGGHYLRVGGNISYVWGCEENKNFIPSTLGDINTMSSKLFSKVLGIDSREYTKILARKELT